MRTPVTRSGFTGHHGSGRTTRLEAGPSAGEAVRVGPISELEQARRWRVCRCASAAVPCRCCSGPARWLHGDDPHDVHDLLPAGAAGLRGPSARLGYRSGSAVPGDYELLGVMRLDWPVCGALSLRHGDRVRWRPESARRASSVGIWCQTPGVP
jgi:hypothetical protein